MKNIFKLFILMLLTAPAMAQQLPFTSQYMFNDYVLNPAVGGSFDYMPISTSIRSQWSGLDGAPKTQTVSAHKKIGERVGLGGFLFNDVTGPVSEKGLQLSYAYHLPMKNEAHLSFGLGAMLFVHSLDVNQLKFEEENDVATQNLSNNSFSPDANFGLLYYTDKYKVGISIPQLFQNSVFENEQNDKLNNLVRHYFLHGEYVFNINDDIDIIPSSLIKYVTGAPMQFDMNARVLYKGKYWLGFSYRDRESVVALIGLEYKDFRFGYSYDITLTDIRSYSSGTHELFLSYIIGRKTPVEAAKFN
ncbi:type IX secretion system membrane protein PorP/SprF [Vicingaceae bacterium]|nr:type IX secretion system membrane protein PorP/SprF [Vicingaceae bacterium]